VDVHYAPRMRVAVHRYTKRCCVDLYGPDVCCDGALACLTTGV